MSKIRRPFQVLSALAGIRPGRVWIVVSSVGVAGYFVGQYMTGTLQQLASDHVGLAPTYASKGILIEVVFYVHIIFGGIALTLGPFQFIDRIRRNHPAVHRMIGRGYVISVLVGSSAALIMSTVNSIGISGFIGFGTVAVLWAVFTVMGYRAIRRRDIDSHRAWMMRSFALTYAAVTLRLWLGVLIGVQIPFLGANSDFSTVFANAYAPLPYLAWIPNLIFAELLARRRGLPALRFSRPTVEASAT